MNVKAETPYKNLGIVSVYLDQTSAPTLLYKPIIGVVKVVPVSSGAIVLPPNAILPDGSASIA